MTHDNRVFDFGDRIVRMADGRVDRSTNLAAGETLPTPDPDPDPIGEPPC